MYGNPFLQFAPTQPDSPNRLVLPPLFGSVSPGVKPQVTQMQWKSGLELLMQQRFLPPQASLLGGHSSLVQDPGSVMQWNSLFGAANPLAFSLCGFGSNATANELALLSAMSGAAKDDAADADDANVDQEAALANAKIELIDADLWDKFHQFGTEMVITKSGR